MTRTHGRAILLCMNFLMNVLTLEKIETIISEAAPANTKVLHTVFLKIKVQFCFVLVRFNDFNTVIEMHIF